jgi:hypothetical protein
MYCILNMSKNRTINSRKYYEKHGDKIREYSREYYVANRERIIARIKAQPNYNSQPKYLT